MVVFASYLLALLSLVAAVACWRQAQVFYRQKSGTKLGGWWRLALLVISVLLLWLAWKFWQPQQGTEFTLFFILFHSSWLAWLVVILQAKVKYNSKSVKTVEQLPAEKSWWYKSAVLFLAGPVALLVSIMGALALSQVVIELKSNQWVLAFTLMPLLWGGLAVWLAADRQIGRPLTALVVIVLCSSVVLL